MFNQQLQQYKMYNVENKRARSFSPHLHFTLSDNRGEQFRRAVLST